MSRMTFKPAMIFVAALFSLVLMAPLAAQEESGPVISLNAYGKTYLEHPASEPLLLAITFSNPLAQNIAVENRNRRIIYDNLKKSGSLSGMPGKKRQRIEEMYKQEKLPVFKVGSSGGLLSEALTLKVENARGKEVFVTAHPLAKTANLSGGLPLEANSPALIFFGIEPEALSFLPEGDYAITVIAQARNEKERWQGTVKSRPVKLKLNPRFSPTREEALQRYNDYGEYYLLDYKFDRASQYVLKMLELDDKSYIAMSLRGDILALQGKAEEALISFHQALAFYRQRHPYVKGSVAPEPPEYILERISELYLQLEHK